MLVGTCHCTAIRIEVPGRPDWLIDCNCSICRRNGARWALYETGEVRIVASPAIHRRVHLGFPDDQDDVVRPLRQRHPLGADTGGIEWQVRCEHEELRSAGSRDRANSSIRWRRPGRTWTASSDNWRRATRNSRLPTSSASPRVWRYMTFRRFRGADFSSCSIHRARSRTTNSRDLRLRSRG